MTKIIAQNPTANPTLTKLFGQISPPAGNLGGGDPVAGISKLLSVALQLVLLLAAGLLLLYMLLGTFDWIVSGGEKEKIAKAQNKITSAAVGMILVIAVFTVFTLFMGTILGNQIIDTSGGGWRLIIPTIAP